MREKEEAYSGRQIRIGAVVSYIAIGLNIVAGLVYTPWLVHSLGAQSYGVYTIATSLIAILIMDFGISEAVAKYIAQYRAEGKENKVNELLSVVFKIYLIISVVLFAVFTIMYFFLDNIYVKLTPAEMEQFKIVYLIVAAFNILAFPFTPTSGILLAYEHIVNLKLCDIINRILTIVLTVAALMMGYGLYAVVMVNAISGFVIIGYKLFVIQKNHQFKLKLNYKNKPLIKEILGFSVWVMVLVLTQRCIINITPSLLGALSSSTDATLFGIASTLEAYAYSLGSVVSGMYMARISRLLLDDDSQRFNVLMTKVGKFQFFLIGLLVIGFFCVGKDFMLQWMGPAYVISFYCAIFILVPNLIIWPLLVAATALTAANRVKEHALVNLAAAVISIALEVILVGNYGALGAAIAICSSSIFKGLALMYVYQKYLPIDLKGFVKQVYAPYLIPLLFVLGVGYYVCSNWEIASWIGIGVKAVFVGALYCITIFAVMVIFQKKDIRQIFRMGRKE